MGESKVQKVARGKVVKKVNTAGMCSQGHPRAWAKMMLASGSRMVKFCDQCGEWEGR